MRASLVLLPLFFAVACGGESGLDAGDTRDGGGAPIGPPPGSDGSVPPEPRVAERCSTAPPNIAPVRPAPIPAPAVDTDFTTPFSVAIHADFGAEIAIDGNTGVYTAAGASLPALVYARSSLEGSTLHHAIAVDAARWHLFWIYCRDGQVVGVFSLATDEAEPIEHDATGSCATTETATAARVVWPASAPALSPLVAGFLVDGPGVHLAGPEPGTIQIRGTAFTILPFATVDFCPECSSGHWWEIHSLLVDPAGTAVGFGILYLLDVVFPPRENIALEYLLMLPELVDPRGGEAAGYPGCFVTP